MNIHADIMRMMGPCEREGYMGNCGLECQVLHDGECPHLLEMIDGHLNPISFAWQIFCDGFLL